MIAVYCRVSTDEQARNETITAQLDFARKYCELHGLSDVEFFCDEGISGVIPLHERPAGAKLMEAAKNGVSQVLFYRLDRLGRSARIILNAVHELESCGVRVRSMTEPFDTGEPTGRFLLTVLAGVADLERETIIERTYTGMRRAAEKGRWPGTPPFGYMKDEDGFLIPDERPIPGCEDFTSAGVVRLIHSLVGEQFYTTVQVAEYLNALGIPTAIEIQRRLGIHKNRRSPRKGWLPPIVWHILNDETYAGRRVFKADKTGEEFVVEVPLIISREMKEKVRCVLEEHSRKFWYKPKYQYLLTGLVRCGNCGRIYTGRTVKRRRYGNGEVYLERSYCCASKRTYGEKSCGNPNVNADRLEDFVWQKIVDFVSNPAPALKMMVEEIKKREPGELPEEEKRLEKLLAGKEEEKQKLLELYRKGFIGMADVEEQLKRMENEKRTLSQRLNEVRVQLEEIRAVEKRAAEAAEILLALGEEIKKPLPFERKRQIIKIFFSEIVILPGKPRKPGIKITTYFDPPDDPGNSDPGSLKPPADQARNLLNSSGIKKLRALLGDPENA